MASSLRHQLDNALLKIQELENSLRSAKKIIDAYQHRFEDEPHVSVVPWGSHEELRITELSRVVWHLDDGDIRIYKDSNSRRPDQLIINADRSIVLEPVASNSLYVMLKDPKI